MAVRSDCSSSGLGPRTCGGVLRGARTGSRAACRVWQNASARC